MSVFEEHRHTRDELPRVEEKRYVRPTKDNLPDEGKKVKRRPVQRILRSVLTEYLTRRFGMCSVAVASLVIAAGCASAPVSGSADSNGMRSSSLDAAVSKRIPGELEDLRRIRQDVEPFAAAMTAPITAGEQAAALEEFRFRYFSPWTESPAPIGAELENMKDFAETSWYGENRIPVPAERIKALLDLATPPEGIPVLNEPGIAVAPAPVRALPTLRPFYKSSEDFPFDQLQYTELKLNEPVRMLYLTADGRWLFVKTSSVYGWVEADAVKPADESVRRTVIASPQLVIVKDFAVVRDRQGKALPQPRVGTLYPLLREDPEEWIVLAAASGNDDKAYLKTARIARNDAHPHPVPFNSETVAEIGNELLKTPYGWGELFRDRDCSATTRDFFLPFGVWLPRNSLQQLNLGPFVPLASLSNAEKEDVLRRQGVPFRTLLHRKGHIMLYAGLDRGKPVIFHNTWAVSFKLPESPEQKFFIGRTVLTTLEAGKELPLSKGTTLDHLDGIIQLPVPISSHGKRFNDGSGKDLLNYPGITSVKDNRVFFADGTSMPYDDGKLKTVGQKVLAADIEDHFAQFYPAFTSIAEPDRNEDPGRFRNEALLAKLYGESRIQVEKNLTEVRWLPNHGGGRLLFNKNEKAAVQLQKASDELDKLPEEYMKYLKDADVTYYHRAMAASDTELTHRYGVAIDLNRKISTSWEKEGEGRYRNEIPQKIVETFEKYGFVWGGRWYHFDTGHFEYRPEMFDRVD